MKEKISQKTVTSPDELESELSGIGVVNYSNKPKMKVTFNI